MAATASGFSVRTGHTALLTVSNGSLIHAIFLPEVLNFDCFLTFRLVITVFFYSIYQILQGKLRM